MAPPVTGGPEAPVLLADLGAVERELDRLWQANAAGDRAVLRAATFNLIAIAPSEDDGYAAAAVLAELMAQHPGRILVLCADAAAAGDRLEAWVSMHCRAIGPGSQVCGEQVVLVAAGAAMDRVGGALGALLLPDCPTIAWWRGGPGPAAPVLDRIRSSVDALLLDGDRFPPPVLVRWVVAHRRGEALAVGDLAWERARPWRSWMADCFDAADTRAELAACRQVRVTCGREAAVTGLLYVGWLASRLGWGTAGRLAPTGDGRWQGRLGAVSVAVDATEAAGALTAVSLAAGAVRVELERGGTEHVTVTATRGGDVVQHRVLRYPEADEVSLVGGWLERPRWDPVHGEALAALAAFTAAG
jgi:glucose-6-phosphate dehydrogenase assembly protein OpcA